MFLESKTMREREIEIKSKIENGKINLSIYVPINIKFCLVTFSEVRVRWDT